MNRRNFLTSSTLLGLGTISMFPSAILANPDAISITDIGNGFSRLSNQLNIISIESCTQNFIDAHQKLCTVLDKKEYIYNSSNVTQLSDSCFAVPLCKKSLLGFESKELALLIKNDQGYQHYVLDEKTSYGFTSFMENFSQGVDSNQLDINALAFVTPTKVIKESYGKESIFTYENEQKTKITLKSSSNRHLTLIQ